MRGSNPRRQPMLEKEMSQYEYDLATLASDNRSGNQRYCWRMPKRVCGSGTKSAIRQRGHITCNGYGLSITPEYTRVRGNTQIRRFYKNR